MTRQVLNQALAGNVSNPDERPQHLDFLLQVLQTEGYLVHKAERYHFRSALLKDFWKRSRLQ